MRRRRNQSNIMAVEGSTLGSNFHTAVNTLNQLADNVVSTHCKNTFGGKEILQWLVPPVALAALEEGRKYTEPYTRLETYPIGPQVVCLIEFKDLPYLVPLGSLFLKDPPPSGLLHELVEKTRKIHESFSVAIYVLRWLDSNCTAGAMRYYWPAIMALCPDAPMLSGELPRRHAPPVGNIAPLLSMLRESATTIAAAQFANDKPRDYFDRSFALNFTDYKFVHEASGLEITAYQRGYNFSI